MDDLVDIADLAKSAGLTASALRYYERRGLVEPAARQGLRRQYRPDTLRVIRLIALLQRVGMTLEEIRSFLDPQSRHNHQWRARMTQKRAQLRQHLDETTIAIAGVEHALECSRSDLLDCPGFRRLIENDDVEGSDIQES
jgi:DNA-binding transcriptional MerR regulator